MAEIKSVREFLGDIIEGKMGKPTCSGFPIPGTHEVTEWELHIRKRSYNFCCPLCGFGQAGSLSKDESDWLLKIQGSEQEPEELRLMKVQPLLSTKGDGLYDLSLCTDDVIFEIIEMKKEEIRELLEDIGRQFSLLEEAEE